MIIQGDFSLLSYCVYTLWLCVHVLNDPEQISILMFGQSSVRVWLKYHKDVVFDKAWTILFRKVRANITFSSLHGLWNINIYNNIITFVYSKYVIFVYGRHVLDSLNVFLIYEYDYVCPMQC